MSKSIEREKRGGSCGCSAWFGIILEQYWRLRLHIAAKRRGIIQYHATVWKIEGPRWKILKDLHGVMVAPKGEPVSDAEENWL